MYLFHRDPSYLKRLSLILNDSSYLKRFSSRKDFHFILIDLTNLKRFYLILRDSSCPNEHTYPQPLLWRRWLHALTWGPGLSVMEGILGESLDDGDARGRHFPMLRTSHSCVFHGWKPSPSWICDGGILNVTPFLKTLRLRSPRPRRWLRLMLSLLSVWIAGGGGVCNVKSKLSC
jgi:hypothetical protein